MAQVAEAAQVQLGVQQFKLQPDSRSDRVQSGGDGHNQGGAAQVAAEHRQAPGPRPDAGRARDRDHERLGPAVGPEEAQVGVADAAAALVRGQFDGAVRQGDGER